MVIRESQNPGVVMAEGSQPGTLDDSPAYIQKLEAEILIKQHELEIALLEKDIANSVNRIRSKAKSDGHGAVLKSRYK